MRAVRTLVAVAVAVTGAAAINTGVGAYATYAHWASNTATFYVNPVNADVSQSAAIAALQTGMDVWNTQSGTSFRYQYGGTVNDTATAYDNRNVIMFRNATNGGAVASTYSWWSGDQLMDADIVFWDGAFTFFTGSSGCSGGLYIEDTAAHELGHALGMDHSAVADATMYSTVSWCSTELRTLAADDIAGVKTLYPSGTPTPSNTPPTVSITAPTNGTSVTNGATVTFTGTATDTKDGVLTSSLAWTSNIDGSLGFGGSVSRVLSAGTHTVTANVTDSAGLQATKQVTVTVAAAATTPPPPSGPTLSATGRKVKGLAKADLKWNGLSGSSIDVYRNAARFETVPNDGAETDAINKKGSFTVTYQVCVAGTSTCSNTASVSF